MSELYVYEDRGAQERVRYYVDEAGDSIYSYDKIKSLLYEYSEVERPVGENEILEARLQSAERIRLLNQPTFKRIHSEPPIRLFAVKAAGLEEATKVVTWQYDTNEG